MASIEVREGRSGASFRVSWRLEDGRQQSRSFRSRAEAKAFRSELEGARARGVIPDLSAERRERLGNLPGWTWDALSAAWERGFTHLEAFVADRGHARPSSTLVFNEYPLGNWVGAQRQRNRRGGLAVARRERLEALPGWTWSTSDAAWEEGFSHLAAFVAEHGHAQPSVDFVVDAYRLGKWVNNLRSRRQRLSPKQQERLEALSGWTWNARASKN